MMELSFPLKCCNAPAQELISRLLLKDCQKRIVNDFTELKSMSFFEGYSGEDWEKMDSGSYPCCFELAQSEEENVDLNAKSSTVLWHLEAGREALGRPMKSRKDTYWDA